ncbi:diguanylate cyclase domain-containing protein [Nitrincola sp. A-D6]|uniref:diguanylate cyclase domain-containing protein n=1 Tax=Nitrincola sp. A-D6 TaxID=1545442 RepID=UPI00118529AF|nr:diguanylate cyclase [Nitrincola sp. A-D6]
MTRISMGIRQCCLLLALLLTLNAQADTQSVRIGVYENPPKIMLGPDGQPSGILGELILEIAKREDWQLQVVPCNWDACLQLLHKGEIELMPDVAFSEQRQTLMSFHHLPALHSWSQVFRHADIEIDSVLDLDQKRVAILAGSIQLDFLEQINQEFGIQMELIRVSDLQSALNLLAEGKADALATNNLFGGYHINGYDLEPTSILFQPARLFFATSINQHTELLEKIDYWLEQWKTEQDSPYNRILQNWQTSVEVEVIPKLVWVGLVTLLGLLLLALLTMRYLRQKVQNTLRELQVSDDKLTTILNNLQAYVYIKDPQHHYVYASPKVCELFGFPEEEIIGKTDAAFFDSESTAEIFRLDDRALINGESIVKEEVNKLPGENEPRTFLSIKVPMLDAQGNIYALCGLATDISEQKRHKKEVHQLIFYDLLTGLPNRRLLMDRLQHSLASRHNQQGNGAVILIDLDNFRTLNDTLGHQAGDQLLTGIAERLSKQVRVSDTLARFGGDEFMLLLEDLSADDTLLLNQVEQVLDKVIEAFERPFRIQEQDYTTSASLGVALYSDSKHNPEELIKRAELAIYDAKKVGRNQIRFFDTSMQQKAEHRAKLEFGLRRALKDQEFILYYQPSIMLKGK